MNYLIPQPQALASGTASLSPSRTTLPIGGFSVLDEVSLIGSPAKLYMVEIG